MSFNHPSKSCYFYFYPAVAAALSAGLLATFMMDWKTEVPGWCNSTSTHPYLLKMDEACLTLHNHDQNSASTDDNEWLELWGQSKKCYKCPLWKLASIKAGSSTVLVVNTTYETLFELKHSSSNQHSLCNFSYHFGEFGQYSMNLSEEDCGQVLIDIPPANIYLPLVWSALVLFLLLLAWGLKCIMQERNILHLWSCCSSPTSPSSNPEETTMLIPSDPSIQTVADQSIRHRIRCLDAFRGITIMSMILVNYGGGGYWFLEHSPWNGFTFADVIFPWFVWMMGASCVLSINSKLRHAIRKRRILLSIARRSLVMFGVGFLLNTLGNNNIHTLRVLGVFQRLSFVYLIVASLELLGFDPEDNRRYAWYAPIRDLVCSWRQWIVVTVLVTTQLLITFLLPVPGCPLGYLGAGGLENGASYRNCTGGAARLVDVTLLGVNHIYQRPTPRAIYDTAVAFDPEGLLGSLTCVLCAYLGAEAAKILLTFPSSTQRITRWITWSVFTGLLGGSLCSFSIEEGPIPINKNLWSVSFVLVTSSFAFGLFAALYVFIDVLAWWSGAPFRYAGMNALLLYIGHVFARPLLPFSWTPVSSTHSAHFIMNSTACAIWMLIAWILYRKRLFLTL